MINQNDINNLQVQIDAINIHLSTPIAMRISGTSFNTRIDIDQGNYHMFDCTGGDVASTTSTYLGGLQTGMRLK